MEIGKVLKFDGVVGTIITDKKEYIFSKENLLEEITNNDLVEFIPYLVKTPNVVKWFAKDIKKFK